MNPYLVNWYLSFLSNRKQRLVFQGTVCDWKEVNKGTTQGSVSGPHLFNLFINDLEVRNCPNTTLIKFADDSSILIPITKSIPDEAPKALTEFKDWSYTNCMPGNDNKSKEVLFVKKGVINPTTAIQPIEQRPTLKILGVTFEATSRFRAHVKEKLIKANKCLFIIRNLRNDGYSQNEIDLLFKSLVLSQLTYALPVYAASPPELTMVQNFLTRCYKRKYISSHLNIYSLLEKSDRALFKKIKNQPNHPLREIMPKTKPYSIKLRRQEPQWPRITTERFKNSFVNRCIFKYNLSI